jgi:hypothetical protein
MFKLHNSTFSMMGFICYYGHVQNTSNLGENIFTSNFLGALVEVVFNPQNNVGLQSLYRYHVGAYPL